MVTSPAKGQDFYNMEQPDISSIELSQREQINDLFKNYGHGDSAHCFNSLFIWEKDMKISAYICPDLYAPKLYAEGSNTWFFPVGTDEKKKAFIADRLQENNLVLRYMTEQDVSFLKEFFPDSFQITAADSDSEYICDRNTIENLPGKGLSRKKRYVKQLVKEHTFEIKSLDDETIPDIHYILDIWRRNKDFDPNVNDREALNVMLEYFSQLNILGIVLYMDDVPCSVMAGYYLGEDTLDCCIQKSVVNIYGLQYYVRQQFSYVVPENVNFYNFEEDLGIEGLRQAKEFMHPCKKIDMYTGRSQ